MSDLSPSKEISKSFLSEPKRLDFVAHLPMTYLHKPTPIDDSVVIFLHGYTDSAAGFLKRCFRGEPDFAHSILAPNGPFPLPVKEADAYKEAFAWYFWEQSKNKMFIPPGPAVAGICNLVNKLGYRNKPKVIVGFSQGGFLIPYLIPMLSGIKAVVGIGAGYRVEDYPPVNPFPLVAIHGSADDVVPLSYSRQSFDQLLASGKIQGEYHEFQDLKHTLHSKSASFLIKRIGQLFA